MIKKKYSNLKINYSHGIMFHHFHDLKKHKTGQGSISKKQFSRIINFIGRKNILDADDFIHRYKKKTLKKNHVCFTFDDGILSQYDIALPVLKKFKIKAFFFVYSSMFTNKPDLLEVYRYFRLNFFSSVDHFYKEFFNYLKPNYINFLNKNKKIIKKKKITYPHYSINDIKFRLIRNNFLKKNEYRKIMVKLFEKKRFVPNKYYDRLYINRKHLIKIKNQGHVIGLHSHTHPTDLKMLNYIDQFNEYKKNIEVFSKILNMPKEKFNTMSHPCGSYNNNTLKILKKFKVEVGFLAKMLEKNKKKFSMFEIPRQDHADIIKKLNA